MKTFSFASIVIHFEINQGGKKAETTTKHLLWIESHNYQNQKIQQRTTDRTIAYAIYGTNIARMTTTTNQSSHKKPKQKIIRLNVFENVQKCARFTKNRNYYYY